MGETVLLGRGQQMQKIPRAVWEEHLAQSPQHFKDLLSFMSEDHHRVRYFAVKELPARGAPLEPEAIAQALDLLLRQVNSILAELEQKLFFLVRDANGAVAWAFPVTVEPTPHRLIFSTGERLYGA